MKPKRSLEAPILVAIPGEDCFLLCQRLEQKGLKVLPSTSQAEALAIISSQPLCGLITVAEWAVTSEANESTGLLHTVNDRLPTLTLIRSFQHFVPKLNEIYRPPLHEYCSLPVDLNELPAVLQRLMMAELASNEDVL